jgi:hypothetical protein
MFRKLIALSAALALALALVGTVAAVSGLATPP